MGNPIEGALERVVAAVDRAGEKWHDAIRAGLAQTEKAVRITAARNRPFTTSGLLWGAPGRLTGWSVINPGGGAVTVTFTDGHDGSGDFVAGVVIPAASSSVIGLPGSGVSHVEALYVTVTGGPVTGSAYLGAVD